LWGIKKMSFKKVWGTKKYFKNLWEIFIFFYKKIVNSGGSIRR
jgi:hypothetical protein